MGPVLLALTVAALLVGGCSDESTEPNGTGPIEQTPDLDDPLGGFTAQDEDPAFGDSDLAGSAEAETPYEDAMANDPEITRLRSSHPDSVATYAVTILWGMLADDPSVRLPETDPTEHEPIDWSGQLQVNRGGVLLRSVVAFEANDEIVDPRPDRQTIQWISHTTISFDGIRVLVYQPLVDGQTVETDSLVIEAGAYRYEFLVNDLVDLDYVETVDDLGNKFSIRSVRIEPTVCAHGFLGGAWILPEDPTERGQFRGRWIGRSGRVAGFLRGHFGINSQGKKVFFGKYVDLDGRFKGILRGAWEDAGIDTEPGHSSQRGHYGWFRGDWIDEKELILGSLRGAWRAVPEGGNGFFEGAWKGVCLNPIEP